jgi:hypothetical protein
VCATFDSLYLLLPSIITVIRFFCRFITNSKTGAWPWWWWKEMRAIAENEKVHNIGTGIFQCHFLYMGKLRSFAKKMVVALVITIEAASSIKK